MKDFDVFTQDLGLLIIPLIVLVDVRRPECGVGEKNRVVKLIDVPPDIPPFVGATLEQECWAWGGGGALPGSASCSAKSDVSYEIFTDAAASIVFRIEETFGLESTQLDVLPVPEPGSQLMHGIALATLFAVRAAQRRGR